MSSGRGVLWDLNPQPWCWDDAPLGTNTLSFSSSMSDPVQNFIYKTCVFTFSERRPDVQWWQTGEGRSQIRSEWRRLLLVSLCGFPLEAELMNGLLETETEFLMCGIFSDGKKVKREHLVHFFLIPFCVSLWRNRLQNESLTSSVFFLFMFFNWNFGGHTRPVTSLLVIRWDHY